MKSYCVLRGVLLLLLAPLFCFGSPLLEQLGIKPAEEAVDYVNNKTAFQLHALITEQRHPVTKHLSQQIKLSTEEGLKALFQVDEDISHLIEKIADDPSQLEMAISSVKKALIAGRRIYIYGCGATGRLAKQMESTFWRPFWKKVHQIPAWKKISQDFPQITEAVVGEITGGDRALISSLEGFEDLLLIGKMQLHDHGIGKGDVVFAITEGGETSSVIGTILEAQALYGQNGRENLFFIYNNPSEVLLPLKRSHSVLTHPDITKICLATGPQAITGSTRMQATTSETIIMGLILETASEELLQPYLSLEEQKQLGLSSKQTLREKLVSFSLIQKAVSETRQELAALTNLEAEIYAKQQQTVYFAEDALMTVFIDSTERAPTFRLAPLDSKNALVRHSWIRVSTPEKTCSDAWNLLLQRPFKGLSEALYAPSFAKHIDDSFLKASALRSLKRAGDQEQTLYDFSFGSGILKGECGILVLFDEEQNRFSFPSKSPQGVICVGQKPHACQFSFSPEVRVDLQMPKGEDPLGLRRHVALKMLLNAHSTAVMAKLERIVGNTMTYVNPGNLKLIGRATFLIQLHVNDHLPASKQITYEEANAVLFDAKQKGYQPEVGLSIIRILETLKRQTAISWEESAELLKQKGLEGYLSMN